MSSPLLPGYPRTSFIHLHTHTLTCTHTSSGKSSIFHQDFVIHLNRICFIARRFLIWGPCTASKQTETRTIQCQQKVKNHLFLLYRHFYSPNRFQRSCSLFGRIITAKKRKKKSIYILAHVKRSYEGHSCDLQVPRGFPQHSRLPDHSQMHFLDLKKALFLGFTA